MFEKPKKVADERPFGQRTLSALTRKESLVYRGNAGLPFIRESIPAPEKRVELNRIRREAREFMEAHEGNDKHNRLERDQARLVAYFCERLGSTRRTLNFNLSKGISKEWAKGNAGRNRFEPDHNQVLNELFTMDRHDDSEIWAAGVRDLISSLSFLLRARMSEGSTYATDKAIEGNHRGIETLQRESAIASAEIMDLVDQVYYLGKLYDISQPRMQKILPPLFRFQKLFSEKLLKATPETTLAEVFNALQVAYHDSELDAAVSLHRQLRGNH